MPPRRPLHLTREQILAHRLRASGLTVRRPRTPAALATAAAPGLTDSMPRAALLSLHARVTDVDPAAWESPPLVQVWGPRYSAYVIAAADLPVFTLGRLPDDQIGRRRASTIADRLAEALGERRLDTREVARAVGLHPSALRYAAPTGRFLIRWDGAHQPLIHQVPAPDVDPVAARLELARRHLALGPATPESFAAWAGVRPTAARAAFADLADEALLVTTPLGEAWVPAADEAALRTEPFPAADVRLLPSGDPFTLLQGADRDLLVPDPAHRARLWPPRVWPGALLLAGEVAGTWRRAEHAVTVTPWRPLTAAQRSAVEAEAVALPLPGLTRPVALTWA